jgi:two-component system chemotaxis response regulator CheB
MGLALAHVSTQARIRVLVLDASPITRKLVVEIINRESDMEVVGIAETPGEACGLLKALKPDALTLDMDMPDMDSLDFLDNLMRRRPMPVLAVSSLASAESGISLRALELGAMDAVLKQHAAGALGVKVMAETLTRKLRDMMKSRPNFTVPVAAPKAPASAPAPAPKTAGAATPANRSAPAISPITAAQKLIVVGSSTGGTEAVRKFLAALPASCPAILIAQHMPENFTGAFAKRLDAAGAMRAKEAEHNERVLPGHIYVAPGHSHLQVVKTGGQYTTCLSKAEPVNRHRPSVDVLFESAARHAGRNAIGLMFTGMGRDGAAGMLQMREAGAYNFAQDEASCVVFGMPKAAIDLNAVHAVLPLDKMAAGLIEQLTAPTR